MAISSSTVITLPSTTLAKPHGGLIARLSPSTSRLASSMRLQIVLALEFRSLGGDEPKQDLLSIRHEPLRGEGTAPFVVIFEEEAVDVQAAEASLGQVVVCPLGNPLGAGVAATAAEGWGWP